MNANLPPRAQADIKEEADGIIESIEDSHEEEEHILPTPELDEGNDGMEEDDAVKNQGQHDPEGQMPGQLPAAVTQVEEVRTYAQRKERAKGHIRQLLGQEVEIRQRNQCIRWRVVEESIADVEDDTTTLGLRDKSVLQACKDEAIGKLFLHLLSPRWQDKLEKMNAAVDKQNSSERGTKIRPFTESEFLVALGLIVGAVEYGTKGSSLWLNGKKSTEADWCSILPHPNFDRFMLEYRFKQFQQFLPSMYKDQSLKDSGDPWWKFAAAVTEFNDHHLKTINGSKVKVVDESMCAYQPRTTAMGGLPNIQLLKENLSI